MADTIPVTLTAGTLAPPACYSDEQERYDAYIAATTASITGSNLQWIVSVGTPAPADQGKAWLRIDVNGYPKEVLLWVTASGTWVRIFTVPHYPVSSGGVANALTATYNPTFLIQAVGERYWFIAAATNTGACTFKVDSLPAYSIKKKVNQDLAAGEIVAGQVVELVWDGTNYQMVSQSASTTISASDVSPGTARQFFRTQGSVAPFTSAWESGYITAVADYGTIPAAGSAETLFHGLGVEPISWSIGILCTDAAGDAGYSQYDYVPVDSLVRQPQSESDNKMTGYANASLLGFVRNPNVTTIAVNHPTTGAETAIDESKWKVVGRAIR